MQLARLIFGLDRYRGIRAGAVTGSDVVWIAIPVAIVVVLVLVAIVTQSRTPRHDAPALEPEPNDEREHET